MYFSFFSLLKSFEHLGGWADKRQGCEYHIFFTVKQQKQSCVTEDDDGVQRLQGLMETKRQTKTPTF
jgi:hypothetical protein